jgi:hypothetical protein
MEENEISYLETREYFAFTSISMPRD